MSMDQVTQELEAEGVKAFADDYEALLQTIAARCQQVIASATGD